MTEWGPRWTGPDEVLFRVWSPDQKSVGMKIADRTIAMVKASDGWFEATVTGVTAGTPYQFVMSDGFAIPDPASRSQQNDVHGPSLLTDPQSFRWRDEWSGRPWEEAVVYELHIGTFTSEGTFRAAIDKLKHLADLGVTAIEIMPVAQFAGQRGWGYDGVLLYAPHSAYGSPDDLKALVDAAHGHGLMVLLDVVYNHFGPDGNYIHKLAPGFFHPERHTPWGGAIAYEEPAVRSFFVDNALYWLDEFRFDGLRLDAVDQVQDPDSEKELLLEIAETIRQTFPDRHIHTATEDNRNVTFLHERGPNGAVALHTAEWNDDVHNAMHVIATGETDGYYEDFSDQPVRQLARALAEGYSYQGEPSAHADGKARGVSSVHLPPTAFVDFLQNHDQVGNRALGERLVSLAPAKRLSVLTAILLLSPHIPMLFMGEEWGDTSPFFFFTDFEGELADAVRNGRRKEFAKFAAFRDEAKQKQIPDPNAETTFASSKLDWSKTQGSHWLAYYRNLLAIRHEHIVPLLKGVGGHTGTMLDAPNGVVAVDWRLIGGRLSLRANLGSKPANVPAAAGNILFAEPVIDGDFGGTLAPDAMFYALERSVDDSGAQ